MPLISGAFTITKILKRVILTFLLFSKIISSELNFSTLFGQICLIQRIKIKVVWWRQKSAPRLIRICSIEWWCSHFLFWTKNTIFGHIWFKKSKLFIEMNLSSLTNSIIPNSMVMFICPVLDGNRFSCKNLIQKLKTV